MKWKRIMTKNKAELKDNVDAEIKPIDEISQLRSIVFGASEHKLIEQIEKLRISMEQSVALLDHNLSDKISIFQQNVDLKFSEMDKQISSIDKAHDDNELNIQKSLDNLHSEHEMFASATQQDIKNTNQLLDNEIAHIANNFEQQLKQLQIHSEGVSSELSSSKTDRKTLAKLLATMATNLEND